MLLSQYMQSDRPRGRAAGRIKLLLIGIAALFVLGAVYTSVLIGERQETLKRVSRYNVTWLASQTVSELARLQQRIAAAAVPGSGVDRDEVQLRLDILASRAEILRGGDMEGFFAVSPEYRAIASELAAAVEAAQPLVDALAEAESVRRLQELLSPFDQKVARLAAVAYTRSADEVATDQEQLSWLHWLFSSILVALAFCGVGLFLIALWHNKVLRQVHGELLTRTAELHTQNSRFNTALSNMSQALCMVDADQRLIVCNRRYLELFGLPPGLVRPGAAMREILRAFASAGGCPKELAENVHAEQQELVRERRPGSFIQEHGSGWALAVLHRPMPDSGWIATYEDITERRRAESRIAYMAQHDTLTGLFNRRLLREQIEQELDLLGCQGGELAVLCLDLDRFKEVNDTLGHPAGDALLRAVAQRLRGCVREVDAVARLGGDEFVILQVAAAQPGSAAALAERLVDVVGAPYDLDGHSVGIGVSIGIALAPGDGDGPDRLLKNADLALYHAKTEGRGTFRFFKPEMEAHLEERRALQAELRGALEGHQLEVFYQPQVNIEAGRVSGFEALLRWHHPERGSVSPAEFVPVAEETNLIVPIGEWVLRQACADAKQWPDDMTVAVNLSPLQFKNPNLVQAVSNALAEAGLPPNRLEVEITESVLLEDNEAVHVVLHELRGLGLKIALDDFGTGYSSLSYLRSFPFDKIKIDQSFVREMLTRSDCASIVNSIISLASSLGMTTVAEGVESHAQLERLRQAGCTEVQGYHFGRPTPAAEVLGSFCSSVTKQGLARLIHDGAEVALADVEPFRDPQVQLADGHHQVVHRLAELVEDVPEPLTPFHEAGQHLVEGDELLGAGTEDLEQSVGTLATLRGLDLLSRRQGVNRIGHAPSRLRPGRPVAPRRPQAGHAPAAQSPAPPRHGS